MKKLIIPFIYGALGVVTAVASFNLAGMLKPDAIEITGQELLTARVVPGGTFTFRHYYRKNRDCPGNWIIRWRRLGENATPVMARGLLGTNDPGEYVYDQTYPVPEGLVAGDVFEVREIDISTCEDGNSITRSPWLRIVVE